MYSVWPISKKIFAAVTFWASFYTSSTSNKTLKTFRQSKLIPPIDIFRNATSHFVLNFEKLEPTLRALKIHFNSKTVELIMRKERGQALRILYQVKMVLEKVYPPADISIVAKTGKFGDNQPAQKIV